MPDQTVADLNSRALVRAHALAEQWQGDQTRITRAQASSVLMEVIQLHGWTQTAVAPEPSPVCACGHPQARHNTACSHCPCVGYAQTWPRQASPKPDLRADTAAADRLVAEARRNVHESLTFLAVPEVDRVRALIADLETAVEGRTAIQAARQSSPKPTGVPCGVCGQPWTDSHGIHAGDRCQTQTETDAELHARRAHPDWEYATTTGPRKQWDDVDVPPADDNGDPDPTWQRNVDAGHPGEGWERFDYTEESYWRRPKAKTADRGHACDNCDGIDPASCLTNPQRPAAPVAGLDDNQPSNDRVIVRCTSCEHQDQHHDADGRCWFTVEQGIPGRDLVCPCKRRRPTVEEDETR